MNLNLGIMCPNTAQKDMVRAAVPSYELKTPTELGILRSMNGVPKQVQHPSLKGSESVEMTTKSAASQIFSPLPKQSIGHHEVSKYPFWISVSVLVLGL